MWNTIRRKIPKSTQREIGCWWKKCSMWNTFVEQWSIILYARIVKIPSVSLMKTRRQTGWTWKHQKRRWKPRRHNLWIEGVCDCVCVVCLSVSECIERERIPYVICDADDGLISCGLNVYYIESNFGVRFSGLFCQKDDDNYTKNHMYTNTYF